MPDNTKVKRPASHRWTIGILAFMTAGFIIFLIDLFTGRSGTSPKQYWPLIAILSVGAVALLAIVLGGRRQWAYYVSAGSLAIWACRAVYTLFCYVHYFFFGGGSVSTPYFHLAERDKPFVVQQHVPFGRQVLIAIGVGLLVWLFVRFTFGQPSRSYFGFCDKDKS